MEHEVDELKKLEHTPVVELPEGQPLEAKSTEFVAGPYYADAEERIEGLEKQPSADDHSTENKKDWSVDRRDFMRLFSATAALGASACVRRPVEKAVPYVNQPIEVVPGVPNYYASTCGGCAAGCGVMVKTREGRPVKIEGAENHPISQGALCGLGQAQIQALYHPERLQGPYLKFGNSMQKGSWDSAFELLAKSMKSAKNVGIVTSGTTGHRKGFFEAVLAKLGSNPKNLYRLESNSLYASIAKAHELAYGLDAIPRFEIDKSKLLVGIGTDFLDNGISYLLQSKGFVSGYSFRDNHKNKFVQFESFFSVTGGKADERHVIPAGSELAIAFLLLRELVNHPRVKGDGHFQKQAKTMLVQNQSWIQQTEASLGVDKATIKALVEELLATPSLVMAGGSGSFDENSTRLQLVTLTLNELIGAYGRTLHLEKEWHPNPVGSDDLARLKKDLSTFDTVFFVDVDPLFALPKSWDIAKMVKGAKTVVSMQSFPADVDKLAEFVFPVHHYLEAWGDEQPVAGFWSMRQPAVRPLTDSRQPEDVFLWTLAHLGKSLPYADYRSYLEEQWKKIHPSMDSSLSFDLFFKSLLRKGSVGNPAAAPSVYKQHLSYAGQVSGIKYTTNQWTLVSPLDTRLKDGRGAHLPVLQEVPDPMTTIAWDTWAAINPNTMKERGLKRNQVIELRTASGIISVAVYPMPGLHPSTIMVPRGNGHTDKRSTISYNNGVNPLDLFGDESDPLTGQAVTSGISVGLSKTDKWYKLATLQKTTDIQNRKDIVKKVSVAKAGKLPLIDLDDVPDLFPKLPQGEYRWGMSIDLDRCDGCGACMVACSIENNVPQVGRDQLLMGRQMHWMRLDRYFYGEVDKPTVTFQPMMCQHCNHAPCEAVCPVYATTHDPEGLNAMTYNRCVGTRYCANACPYKVRRFNWWTHKWGVMGRRPIDRNPRAANPDVTVRTRGVMEKCSMCVGRIRDGKHKAKMAGHSVRDGEIKTACQQTCPSKAIHFGNLKDPKSMISKDRADRRAYLVLGGEPTGTKNPLDDHLGLKTLPNVSYLRQVTLKDEEPAHGHGAGHGDDGNHH